MQTVKRNHSLRVLNLCRRRFGNLPTLQRLHQKRQRDAIAHHAPRLPNLSLRDRPLLHALQTDGIAMTSLEALGLGQTEQLLTQSEVVKTILNQTQSTAPGTFLKTASPTLMAQYPGIFAWGLQSRLLNLLEAYLQLPVAYHGVYLRQDLPRNIVRRSRLWHTDMEDDHTLKVAVYLNDVDGEGGPFEYLPKPLSEAMLGQLNHSGGYIRRGAVENLVQPGEWRSCTGPKGTVIIVDSGSLIHRGKVPKRDRYTLFYDYTSRLPRRPYYCKHSLPETELARVAAELTDAQRECIFWRDAPEIVQAQPPALVV